jgi:hypothetical protein
MFRVFPNHKKYDISNSPRWGITSREVEGPLTSHEREEIGDGEEDVQISDCRACTDTAKDEERT